MKCLLKLVAICVLGVLLLVGVAVFGIESVLTEAIKGGVGHATGQETALEGVHVNYGEKGLGFNGLEIANPVGFQEVPLLRIGTISASMQPEILRGEVILVNEIVLDELELALELKGSDYNVQSLMKRLAEIQGKSTVPEQPVAQADEAPEPQKPAAQAIDKGQATPEAKLSIRRIQISGLKASLRISDVPGISGVYSVSIPAIVLEDLDSEMADANLSVWVAVILESVLERALEAGQDVFPGEWQEILKSELAGSLLRGDLKGAGEELEKKAGEELEKLQDQAGDATQELLEKGEDALEKAGIPKDPANALQEELKKASNLRKGFFKD